MDQEVRFYAIPPEKYLKETVEWAGRNDFILHEDRLCTILSYSNVLRLVMSPGVKFHTDVDSIDRERILFNERGTPIGLIVHDDILEVECVRIIVFKPIFKTQEECGE